MVEIPRLGPEEAKKPVKNLKTIKLSNLFRSLIRSHRGKEGKEGTNEVANPQPRAIRVKPTSEIEYAICLPYNSEMGAQTNAPIPNARTYNAVVARSTNSGELE